MTDINKLREGLRCCIKLQKGEPVSCEVCPYNGGRMTCETMLTILEDAEKAVEYQHEHIEAFLRDGRAERHLPGNDLAVWLRALAWREREYLAEVSGDEPGVIADRLEQAAELVEAWGYE